MFSTHPFHSFLRSGFAGVHFLSFPLFSKIIRFIPNAAAFHQTKNVNKSKPTELFYSKPHKFMSVNDWLRAEKSCF